MKSYREFAEEAEYLEERIRLPKFKGKGGKVKGGKGGKGGKGKNGGGGGGGVLPTVGGAAAGGAISNAVGGALSGVGNLVGNLAKGALDTARKAASRHSQEADASEGKPGKPLDKIT